MLLYIIRHGDPIYNPDSLTELGHRQAEALVPRLAPLGFDKIYASPMIRAQQTAEPTCKALGITAEIKDFLSEEYLASRLFIPITDAKGETAEHWCFHQPPTNYKPENSLEIGKMWYDVPALAPDRERGKAAWDEFTSDADDFLCELGYRREGEHYIVENPPYERVAVFCHQGVGLSFLSHLLSIPPQVFWASFDITHSGITVLNFRNYMSGITAPKMLCLSDTSHLFGGGLPTEYNGIIPY